MADVPIPPALEHLTTRPFAFFPAILNVEHNEWLFLKATWSEILVVNTKSQTEIWIPRRFLGEISPVEDPMPIVGLNRELEFKGGTLWPHNKRILKMPAAPIRIPSGKDESGTAPSAFRLDVGDKRILKLMGGVILVMLVAYVLVVNWNRLGDPRQKRVTFTGRDETFLDLSPRDDYYGVVQKLGKPATDRWQSETGAIQYRALSYPDRRYTIILMGSERNSALYIGTLDDKWTPIHSVEMRSGGDTSALLRALKRF